jgi:glycosyltransferase involved in cell wall biosynthesis
MNDSHNELQHFLLTRFNLLLWQNDKGGCPVRTTEWLEHRVVLFEQYCLPSIKNQTSNNFEWIILFDSTTPGKIKDNIKKYQIVCPQLIPVFVEPNKGRYFAEIFREVIINRAKAKRIITTYLDNDDALETNFIEDLQNRVKMFTDGTFFYYDEGYQYYLEDKFLTKIHYPKNHFVSVVENANPITFRSVFGFGGHYYIDTIKDVKVVHIENKPMWCEVVHEKNMINDANFLIGTSVIQDKKRLRNEFSIDQIVRTGKGIYFSIFLPRYVKTFVSRVKNKILGRKW